MSEYTTRILRNIGIAAVVFTTIFSITLYASLNVTNTGTPGSSSTTTITTTTSPSIFFNGSITTTTVTSQRSSCTSQPSNNTSFPAGSVISKLSLNSTGGIAYDSALNEFFITGSNYFDLSGAHNFLYVVDGATDQLRNQTYGGNGPVDIAYDQDNHLLYVADYLSNSVLVLNPSAFNTQVIKNITVGTNPVKLAYNPFNKELYVSNRGSGTISIINTNTNTLETTIPIGGSPFEFAYDTQNHAMYVTDGGANVISEINSTNQIVRTINLGLGGGMITYDQANSTLYDASFGGSPYVYTIDSSGSVIGNISVNYDLNSIAYDPANNDIYAAGNATNGFLYLISGVNNSIVSQIGGQGFIPQEIIPNSPLNTAMFMTSYNELYILSNFANVSTTTQTSMSSGSGQSWTAYQLSNGCTGTLSISYSLPANNPSGSVSMSADLSSYEFSSTGSSYMSCYYQNGTEVTNNCPGINVSAAPATLNYHGGLRTIVQFMVSISDYTKGGAYFLTPPGASWCGGSITPILLIIGNSVPSSIPPIVTMCTTMTGTSPFNPTLSLVDYTGFKVLQIPVS